MVRQTLDEENLIDTTGIADRNFADHSGDIQQGYELGSLTRGLVAYYPMEEGQGQVLHDGALDNLGQINGASWNGSGQVGGDCLSFDGTDDYVDLNALDPNGPFTISLWFNTTNNDNSTIIYGETSGNSVCFGMTIDSGKLDAEVQTDLNFVSPLSSTSIDDGNWHFGIISWDGSTVYVYIDGVLENTSALDGTLKTPDETALGRRAVSEDNYFDGSIDDVRIYDRALSQPEIEALASLTQPQGYLVEERDVPTLQRNRYGDNLFGAEARYEFEGDVTDSWGENDGTDNTSAGFVDGVFGQAKDFDGSDDRVELASDALPTFSSYTLSFWSKHNSVSDADTDQVVDFQDNNGIVIRDEGDGNMYFYQDDDDGVFDSVSTSISNGVWNHWVQAWDGNTVKAYKNGSEVGRFSSGAMVPQNNANPSFGWRTGGQNANFDGALDDVRIYERALEPVEIEQLFNLGSYRIKRGEL